MKKFLLATHNKGKLREITEILNNRYELSPPPPDYIAPPETGTTFKENAFIKAKALHDKYKTPVIADDSGIIVPSLNNEPGIYSARYAGKNAIDEENNQKLLFELENKQNRDAYYECVICCILSEEDIIFSNGKCYGTISKTYAGGNGFGYDPYFIEKSTGISFGNLAPNIKNEISHRALALKELKRLLEGKNF